MRIIPKQVAPKGLEAEIARRRALVIDELVAELRLRDLEVAHKPAPKFRKGRRVNEILVEPLVVDGERLRVVVGQVSSGGNRLRLVVELDKPAEPVWAKLDKREPRQGWESLALGERVVALLDEIREQRQRARIAQQHERRVAVLRSLADEGLRSVGSPLGFSIYGHSGKDDETVVSLSVWNLSLDQAAMLLRVLVGLERHDPCTCERCAAERKEAAN